MFQLAELTVMGYHFLIETDDKMAPIQLHLCIGVTGQLDNVYLLGNNAVCFWSWYSVERFVVAPNELNALQSGVDSYFELRRLHLLIFILTE